jgi:hypothetical protein
MPRAKGIPAYTHQAPTGQARVRINGKDHYLGVFGSGESKAEYERLVRRLKADRARVEAERVIHMPM